MTLAVIGDVHGETLRLRQLLDVAQHHGAAGILLVGDLGPNLLHRGYNPPTLEAQWRRGLEDVLSTVAAAGLPFRFVPGNHDLANVPHPSNADGRLSLLAGLTVLGIGGAGPKRFGFPYEWDESDVYARPVPAHFEVLLSHAPPIRTPLDRCRNGEHAGSDAIRYLVQDRACVMVCGHIHEAAGVARVGECLAMNVGALGKPYPGLRVGFVESTDHVWLLDTATGQQQHLTRYPGQ